MTGRGIASCQARPAVWCRAETLLPWVGCPARHVRAGACQRGAAQRQGERPPGPLRPDTLAQHVVTWHVPPRAALCHGAIRAWAPAEGVVGEGPELGGLDPPGRLGGVPAQATMAGPAEARAHAAAGAGRPLGRRVHMGRHGQGQTAARTLVGSPRPGSRRTIACSVGISEPPSVAVDRYPGDMLV
jgi:hypothetical protein